MVYNECSLLHVYCKSAPGRSTCGVYVIYFHSDNNINILFVKYRTRNKDEDFSNITDVLITKMKNKKLDDKDYGKCACFGHINEKQRCLH